MTHSPVSPERPFVCDDKECGPICDFCQWYRFNGNEVGAYINEGACVHPAHPHPEEPHGGCNDYVCAHWPEADPELRDAHMAAFRRPGVSPCIAGSREEGGA